MRFLALGLMCFLTACSVATIRPTDTNFDEKTGTYLIDRRNNKSLAQFYEAITPNITVKLVGDTPTDIRADNNMMCRSQYKNTTWIGGVYENDVWQRRLCAWGSIGRLRAKNYCAALNHDGRKFRIGSFTENYVWCKIED